MNASEARTIPIYSIAGLLNLKEDPKDIKQLLSDECRISVNGERWYDHLAKKGGGGAIDLVMHVLKVEFTEAVKLLIGAERSAPIRSC